jgi:hypothetical protein
MKKFILGGLAAAAVIAPIALTAGSASASTTNSDGSITVTKGDVQFAMKWNDAAWDENVETPDAVEATGKLITASAGSPGLEHEHDDPEPGHGRVA